MKVSIRNGSPHSLRARDAGRVDIYLNGEKLRYCIEADDVAGEALVYARGDDGEFQRDSDDRLMEVVKRGVVVIVWHDEHGDPCDPPGYIT